MRMWALIYLGCDHVRHSFPTKALSACMWNPKFQQKCIPNIHNEYCPFPQIPRIDISCGAGSSVLTKEQQKPNFIKYSQWFTYNLGLLAAVEHAGGFEHLYQQTYHHIHHIAHSNKIHNTIKEPSHDRPVPRTSATGGGLHQTSGTEVSNWQSQAMRDTRPFSFQTSFQTTFQTAPRAASTSEMAQQHSPPHSPPALVASMSDRVHPTQPSNTNTTAEWLFVGPPFLSLTCAESQVAASTAYTRCTIGYHLLEAACHRVHTFQCSHNIGWEALLEGRAM